MLDLQVNADRVFDSYRAAVPMPSSVFHYTSLEAAVAILRTHTVWCSNVSYSNDPAENAYGHNVLLETVKKDRDFAFAGLLKAIATVDCYATSFSADPDLLPQWRAYCANGRGVALGVDVDVLLKRRRMFFSRIEYDPSQQQQLIRNVMNVFRPAISAARANPRRLRWLSPPLRRTLWPLEQSLRIMPMKANESSGFSLHCLLRLRRRMTASNSEPTRVR